jgi:hypothetical protein
MRKLVLLIVVLLLAAPAVAWGLRGAPGDGSLVVQDGSGVAVVNARGGIIGRFDQGRLLVDRPIDDANGLIVYGADKVREGLTRTLYIGEEVRFRLIGGAYRIRVVAVGMDISAVGRGFAILDDGEPEGFSDAGRYSVNGGPFQAMPSSPTRVSLGTPPPGLGPGGGPGK